MNEDQEFPMRTADRPMVPGLPDVMARTAEPVGDAVLSRREGCGRLLLLLAAGGFLLGVICWRLSQGSPE